MKQGLATIFHRRRGATIVLVLVILPVLFICAALAIDVGHVCAIVVEQQNTSDAASLAGASGLQDGDSTIAFRRTYAMISRNQRFQGYHSLEDQIVQLGRWDSVNQVFTPVDDGIGAFAVRVRAFRSNTLYFFAGVMGLYSTDVSREAVAVGSRECRGIWGLEGVKAGSIYTDSYNSTEAGYDSLTPYENGDICSGGAITLSGSFDINGDVMAGFGHPFTINGNAGTATGLTTSRVDEVPEFSVDLGDVVYSNDNELIGLTDDERSPWRKTGWHLDIKGTDNLTLDPGTYYFESMTLGGGSSITVLGPTTIYISGSVRATGGMIVNETENPADLTILSTGTEFKLGGGSAFYGTLVAPYADVVLSGSGSSFFGALVGKTVTFNGGFEIHVDESLPILGVFDAPPLMLVR